MTEKDVINMPLRKVHALEIISGKKKREYRAFNDHWATRLCVFEDPEDKLLATGTKQFKKVHFYPYNNKWHLDVEVNAVLMGEVDEEFIATYSSEVEVNLGDKIFVICLGNVIETDLEV